MAGRPPKQTVDYFPHYANASSRKTLVVLESQYGNAGYAFWFKLLELLGRTPGHYYTFPNEEELIALAAFTKADLDDAKAMLSMLARLGAIDAELLSIHCIWATNLVDNLSYVYEKRSADPPPKPTREQVLSQYRTAGILTLSGTDIPIPEPQIAITGEGSTENGYFRDDPSAMNKQNLSTEEKELDGKRDDGLYQLGVEISKHLRAVPPCDSYIKEHEAMKAALVALGSLKGYTPRTELGVPEGRIDVSWMDELGKPAFAFEIDSMLPKYKSLIKLRNLGAPACLILRRNRDAFQWERDILLIGLGRPRVKDEEPTQQSQEKHRHLFANTDQRTVLIPTNSDSPGLWAVLDWNNLIWEVPLVTQEAFDLGNGHYYCYLAKNDHDCVADSEGKGKCGDPIVGCVCAEPAGVE